MFRRGAGVFLFDPPPIGDFRALQDAIGDEEWVLHAASQDLPSLRELGPRAGERSSTPSSPRACSGHERVGLGAVVEDTLGITLAKAHSASDWSTRPLPQSWLEYAALDVEHLVDVRDALVAELEEQGKTEFADEEFRAVLEREPKPPREEPVAPPERACTPCAAARRSPSRARCGSRVRSTRGRRTSHPAASCPTGRSSPRCSPTRSPSRTSPR